MYLVLICIVVVASFNIASTLFMAGVKRAQEIAVLKSMGAGEVSILRIFVLQGWAVGVAGTALGISHLATLYPSLRAAQALPAQALRADQLSGRVPKFAQTAHERAKSALIYPMPLGEGL